MTPITETRIDAIITLNAAYQTAITATGAGVPIQASSRVFMDNVIKELAADVIKRDGT
jgi:hypothetical protein